MFISLFGWLWIIAGIIFLIKPTWLRDRLRKKGYKKLRGWLFLLTIVIGGFLIKIGWGVSGLVPKIVVVVGLIAVVKAFFLLKGKAAEKMFTWSVDRPLYLFRLGGLVYIVLGSIILLFIV